MNLAPPSPESDPEFSASLQDLRANREISGVAWQWSEADYQRLLVNPFLFFFAWIMLILVICLIWPGLRRAGVPPFLLGSSLCLAFSPYLFHYHCLDCGRTGIVRHWKSHRCTPVCIRERLGRPGRWIFYSAFSQASFWVWLSIPLLIILGSLMLSVT